MAELLSLYEPIKEALIKHTGRDETKTEVKCDDLLEFLDEQAEAFQELLEIEKDDEAEEEDKEEIDKLKTFLGDLNDSINSFKENKSDAGDSKAELDASLDIFEKTVNFFKKEEAEYEATREEDEEYEQMVIDVGGPPITEIDKMYLTLVRLYPTPANDVADAVEMLRDRIHETLEGEGCQNLIEVEARYIKAKKVRSTFQVHLIKTKIDESLGLRLKTTDKITVESWSSKPRLVISELTREADGSTRLAEKAGIKVGDIMETFDHRMFSTQEVFVTYMKKHKEVLLMLVRPVLATEYDLEAARRILVKQVLQERIRVAQTLMLWKRSTEKLDFEGAIVLMQRMWKNYLSKRASDEQEYVEKEAVVTLQSWFRMNAVMAEIDEMDAAAERVQAIVRGRSGRRRFEVTKAGKHKHDAAARIQRRYKRRHRKRARSAEQMQRIARGRQQRKKYNRQQRAAALMQRIERGHQVRADVKRKDAAALKIQALTRNNQQRMKEHREQAVLGIRNRISAHFKEWKTDVLTGSFPEHKMPVNVTAKEFDEMLEKRDLHSRNVWRHSPPFTVSKMKAFLRECMEMCVKERPTHPATFLANFLIENRFKPHEIPVHFYEDEDDADLLEVPACCNIERLLNAVLDNRVDRDIFIKRMVTSPGLYKKIIPLAFKDPYLAEVLSSESVKDMTPLTYRKEKLDPFMVPMVQCMLKTKPRQLVAFAVQHLIATSISGPRPCALQTLLMVLSDKHEAVHRKQFIYRVKSLTTLSEDIVDEFMNDFTQRQLFINLCEEADRDDARRFEAVPPAVLSPPDPTEYEIKLLKQPLVFESHCLPGITESWREGVIRESYNTMFKMTVPDPRGYSVLSAGGKKYAVFDGSAIICDQLIKVGNKNVAGMTHQRLMVFINNLKDFPVEITLKTRVPKWNMLWQALEEGNHSTEEEVHRLETDEELLRRCFSEAAKAAALTYMMDLSASNPADKVLRRLGKDHTRLTRAQQTIGTPKHKKGEPDVNTYIHEGLGLVLTVPNPSEVDSTRSDCRRSALVGASGKSFADQLGVVTSMEKVFHDMDIRVPLQAVIKFMGREILVRPYFPGIDNKDVVHINKVEQLTGVLRPEAASTIAELPQLLNPNGDRKDVEGGHVMTGYGAGTMAMDSAPQMIFCKNTCRIYATNLANLFPARPAPPEIEVILFRKKIANPSASDVDVIPLTMPASAATLEDTLAVCKRLLMERADAKVLVTDMEIDNARANVIAGRDVILVETPWLPVPAELGSANRAMTQLVGRRVVGDAIIVLVRTQERVQAPGQFGVKSMNFADLTEALPAMASKLHATFNSQNQIMDLLSDTEHAAKLAKFPLKQMMADRGIGLESMGVVRKHLLELSRTMVKEKHDGLLEFAAPYEKADLTPTADFQKAVEQNRGAALMLAEMCARVTSRLLDDKLYALASPASDEYQEAFGIAQKLIRTVLHHWSAKNSSAVPVDPEAIAAQQFWRIDVKVMVAARYGQAALSTAEWDADYDLSRALLPFGFQRFHDRLIVLSGADLQGLEAIALREKSAFLLYPMANCLDSRHFVAGKAMHIDDSEVAFERLMNRRDAIKWHLDRDKENKHLITSQLETESEIAAFVVDHPEILESELTEMLSLELMEENLEAAIEKIAKETGDKQHLSVAIMQHVLGKLRGRAQEEGEHIVDYLERKKEAEGFLNQSLASYQHVFGRNHPRTIAVMLAIARSYSDQEDDYPKALKLFKNIQLIMKKYFKENHAQYARTLMHQAKLYRNMDATDEAIATLRKAASIFDSALGPVKFETRVARDELADCLYNANQSDACLNVMKEQFDKRASNLGYGHPETCRILKLMTEMLIEMMREDDAVKLFKDTFVALKMEMLEKTTKMFADADTDGGGGLDKEEFTVFLESKDMTTEQIEELWKKSEKNEDGELLYENFTAIVADPEAVDPVIELVTSMIQVMLDKGSDEGKSIIDMLTVANELSNVTFGKNYYRQQEIYEQIGTVYLDTQPEKAMANFELSIEVLKSNISSSQMIDVANEYTKVAQKALKKRLGAIAISMYRKAIAIQLQELGKEDVAYINTTLKLAWLMHKQPGHEEEAATKEIAEFFSEVLEASKKVNGDTHDSTLSALTGLAQIDMQRKNYDGAIDKYKQVLAARAKKYGDKHPKTIASMKDLAESTYTSGKLKLARPVCSRGLIFSKKALGMTDELTVFFQELLDKIDSENAVARR